MQSFQEYLQQGHAWLFLPAAVVLGALHGMEPGHSKTIMAAFIIAIRGALAALSVREASRRFRGFGEFARKAPYVSSTLMLLLGLVVLVQGLRHLVR